MKTQTIILTLILALNITPLFANKGTGDPVKTVYSKTETTVNLTDLVPSVPREADFSDAIETNPCPETFLFNLIPVTPWEADFEDTVYNQPPDLKTLAPTTPEQADFSDQ